MTVGNYDLHIFRSAEQLEVLMNAAAPSTMALERTTSPLRSHWCHRELTLVVNESQNRAIMPAANGSPVSRCTDRRITRDLSQI